jgi:Lipid A 3-O-deacylase (PagL).
MTKKLICLAPAICCLVTGALSANAGVVAMGSANEATISNFPYERGEWEAQLLAGALWDLDFYDNQPRFDYALQSLRLGYIVTPLSGGGLFRGDLELLLEAVGGEFFEGPASYLVGGTLLVRWNFVQGVNPKWVPYIQIGGGGLYHDANTNVQDVLGSNVEAMTVDGLGLRYHVNKKWTIIAEVTYRHISNAGTTERNRGLNSLGGQLGVSYFFH